MHPTRTRSAPITLPELAGSFERGLRSRHLSERTIFLYLDALAKFTRYAAAHDLPLAAGEVRREHVEAWLVDRLATVQPSVANMEYRALQQFWKWAADDDEHIVETSPMAKMRPPRLPEKSVPIVDEGDFRKLLATCEGRDFMARRDSALLLFLADTGARRGEVIGLRVEDLDFEHSVAIIDPESSKSRRGRAVPFGDRTARALDRYLRARREHPAAARHELWLGQDGPLTDSGLAQMLARRCRQAGIARIGPHAFRHTFAHAYLADGGNEGDLMRLTGWKSRAMVDRYASSTAAARARAAYRSPVDRL